MRTPNLIRPNTTCPSCLSVSALSLSFVGVQILIPPQSSHSVEHSFLLNGELRQFSAFHTTVRVTAPVCSGTDLSHCLLTSEWRAYLTSSMGRGVLWLQQLVTQQWRWVSPQNFHFIKPTARPSRFSFTSGLDHRTGCPFYLKYFSRYWVAIRLHTLRLRTWCQTLWKSNRKILQIPSVTSVSTDSPVIYTPLHFIALNKPLQITWHLHQDRSPE